MKKSLIIFSVLITSSISILYYFWYQVTKLPDWYSAQPHPITTDQELSNPSEVRSAEARLKAKIEAAKSQTNFEDLPTVPSGQTSNQDNFNDRKQHSDLRQNVEIELSNQEINDLVTSTVAKRFKQQKYLATIPKFYTTIKQGTIESGTVINLADIPKNQLTASEINLLEKTQRTFPFLKYQKIYLGIVGQPRVENGQLKLDNNPEVKFGNLSLSLSTLSQRLNIPQSQLEQKLNRALQVGELQVNDMELIDNKVRLRGSVDKY